MKLRQKERVGNYEVGIWSWCEDPVEKMMKDAKHYLRIGPRIINAVMHNIKVAEKYIEEHGKRGKK